MNKEALKQAEEAAQSKHSPEIIRLLVGYREALKLRDKLEKDQLDLSANLLLAKTQLGTARQAEASAKGRKRAAISPDEMKVSARELETAVSQTGDAEALIFNITERLEQLPNQRTNCMKNQVAAHHAVFLERSNEIAAQLKASDEFAVVAAQVGKAFAAFSREGGGFGSFSWFLGALFSDPDTVGLSENSISQYAAAVSTDLGIEADQYPA